MAFDFEFLGKAYNALSPVMVMEDFFDKNFNLSLMPDMPKPPAFGGKKGAKKAKDFSRVITGLQKRMLEATRTPGRKSTIATTPRGV